MLSKKFALVLSLMCLTGWLSGCVTSAVNHSPAQDAQTRTDVDVDAELSVIEPELPNIELDAELLEQLMVLNFSSFGADWQRAKVNALLAAQSSQDYRLARLATILSLRNNDYTSAAQAGELWLELDKDNENALNTLVIALVGSGQVADALLRLEQFRLDKQDEQDIDAHIREVAGVLIRQRNADAAIEIAADYITRYPDTAQVLLSAAYVADYFKRDEATEDWLAKALMLKPGWDLAAQMKVGLLRRQDKPEEVIAYIEQYVRDNPGSILMRINHAAELSRAEKYADALALMQQVLLDDPENSSALSYAAALAQQLEQPDLAKQLYQRALEQDPQNDEVRWTLAGFAVREQQYLKAERLYQQVESKDSYFRAQLQIANMRYHTRGIKNAINVLRALEPQTEAEYVDVALTRHYLLMRDHQYEEAFGYINDSLLYLPENTELVYARALVAAELSQLELAEKDLRLIIKNQPTNANALNALGYTLADQTERYLEAKELIMKALELRPTDGHILDSMGWVLYRLSDYEGAIDYLKRAYKESKEVEVAAHLGEVLWEAGRQDEAREIWQEAIAKDAKNPILIKTLERYEQRGSDISKLDGK